MGIDWFIEKYRIKTTNFAQAPCADGKYSHFALINSKE